MFRSAISAYHNPIDGVRIGEHPIVMRIMAGIRIAKPTIDRFPVIWDIDRVLRLMRSFGDIDRLSRRLLSWKTAMLTSIAVVTRAGEVVSMTLSGFHDLDEKLVFFLNKARKNNKENSVQKPMTIFRYNKDPLLCPVTHLLEYIERSKEVRGEEKQLFVSTINPFKAIKSETMGRWLKEILKRAGINITLFKGHSVRAASTSKAKVAGATVQQG